MAHMKSLVRGLRAGPTAAINVMKRRATFYGWILFCYDLPTSNFYCVLRDRPSWFVMRSLDFEAHFSAPMPLHSAHQACSWTLQRLPERF